MKNSIHSVIFIFFLTLSPQLYADNMISSKLNLDGIYDSLPNKEQKLEGSFIFFKDKSAINISKPQTVTTLCGRSMYFLKSLSMKVLKNGFSLNPSNNDATFNFRSEKELLNCLGNGSKLSFPKDMWFSLFENKYQGGGFSLVNGKFKFWQGTKGKTQENITRIFDGKKWVKEGSVRTPEKSRYSKEDLRKLQSRLNNLGYNCGAPDGVWGKKSATALKLFQKDNNLNETGAPNPKTLDALESKDSPGQKFNISTLSIPLNLDKNSSPTKTKGTIAFVEGKPALMLFSLDCNSCQLEMPLGGSGASQDTVWSPGAVHIFKNGPASSNTKYSITTTDMSVGSSGKLMAIAREGSGSVLTPNHLPGWSFESEDTNPLVFKVDQQNRYVHINGRGLAKSPEGKVFRLNKGPMKKESQAILKETAKEKVTAIKKPEVNEKKSKKKAVKRNELKLANAGKNSFRKGDYQTAIDYLEQARAAEFSGVWQSSYPYLAASYWIVGEKDKARSSIETLQKELDKPSGYLSRKNQTTRRFVRSALKKVKRAIPSSDRSSWEDLINEHLGTLF